MAGVLVFGVAFLGVAFFLGAAFFAGDFLGVVFLVGVTATFLIAFDYFEIGTLTGSSFIGDGFYYGDSTFAGASIFFLKPNPPSSRIRLVYFTLRKPKLLVPATL